MTASWTLRRPLTPSTPWLALARELDLSPALARLAWMRHQTVQDLLWRLDPDPARCHDPFQMHGMEQAVCRLLHAIQNQERIGIYGDYDADGVTATALLARVLDGLGCPVFTFIPNRFSDGYGLSLDCIQDIRDKEQPKLMISVDCGIRSLKEVEASREMGLDWILTDHHQPGLELPSACAVVHPVLGDYPNPHLAGVGVAFKLAQALFKALGRPMESSFWDGLLKLVAFGTISDVAPLVGENALLVRRGLRALAGANAPGIEALLKISRLEGPLRAQDVAYGMGPRLNAAGRLGGAEEALELLLCRDRSRAFQLAEKIDALNQSRKQLQAELIQGLGGMGTASFDLVALPEAHKGILGIVAGHRSRMTGRPAGVCTILDGIAYGSLRAPEGYDLAPMLERAQLFLLGGGGHAQAAGIHFEIGKLAFVRRAFEAEAAEQAARLGTPLLRVDGVGTDIIPPREELDRLEPFGQGFPAPLTIFEGYLKEAPQAFGQGHFRFRLPGVPGSITWFHGEGKLAGDLVSWAVEAQDHVRFGRSWTVIQPVSAQVMV